MRSPNCCNVGSSSDVLVMRRRQLWRKKESCRRNC